ncbi:MAG: hypothetical protein MK078_18270 [Crocinitomicaceae bacterium]|nr:hypothetical protein [Crocinitomicaceae bacterium]
MAEKIKSIPGVDNSMEYLEYTKSYIVSDDPENASFPIYTDGSISTDSISGKEFLIQNFTIENENGVYYQATYSAQFDEYLLNVITNYENENQKTEIATFLNTLKWLE